LRAPVQCSNEAPAAGGRFGRGGGEENADLAVRFDDADRDFALVDTSKAPKRSMGFKQNRPQRPGQQGQAAGARGWEDKMPTAGQRKGIGSSFNKKYNKLNKARYNSMNRPGMGSIRIRDPSVKIDADWLQLDSFDIQTLKELSTTAPTETQDLRWTGNLEAYDEEYDRINSRKPKALRRFDNIDSLFVKTSDDPVIEELATEDKGNVFGTDAVLAHLMACTRSAMPWDIVATYVAGSIFLDVRDEFEFELHSVNETSNSAPTEGDPDAINGHMQLSLEATACHHNFTQQVCRASMRICMSRPLTASVPTLFHGC
jgi:translation initiation factor 3 subunit D